jgi:hypothetical protein
VPSKEGRLSVPKIRFESPGFASPVFVPFSFEHTAIRIGSKMIDWPGVCGLDLSLHDPRRMKSPERAAGPLRSSCQKKRESHAKTAS